MPTPTTTTALARIQTDPVGDAPIATAFFVTSVTVDDQVFAGPMEPISWSITDDKKAITVGGQTLTYAQVSAFVTAIAYQEKAAASQPAS